MNSAHTVAVVLPMFNEAASLAALRRDFEGFDPGPGRRCLLVAVDDGSIDATPALLAAWAWQDDRLKVVTHPQNRGLAAAIFTGMAQALSLGASRVVTMDADATHPVGTIPRLLDALDAGAGIAIASRFAPGGKEVGLAPVRKVLSRGARAYLRLRFPLRGVRDYSTSFRAYTAEVLRPVAGGALRLTCPGSFAASVELLLRLAGGGGAVPVEVPVVLRYDNKQSPSKLRALRTILDYLRLGLQPGRRGPAGRGLKLSS